MLGGDFVAANKEIKNRCANAMQLEVKTRALTMV